MANEEHGARRGRPASEAFEDSAIGIAGQAPGSL